jgi:hypothetical protein
MSALVSVTEIAPSPAEIGEELERVLSSSQFASSNRGASFLRYVVEKVLAGEGDKIKEVVIACDLYGRSSDYDPKVDSAVRVEATRIRAKLHKYYEGPGAKNPSRILIPKGTYVPGFSRAHIADLVPEPLAFPAIPARNAPAVCSPSFGEAAVRDGAGENRKAADPGVDLWVRDSPPEATCDLPRWSVEFVTRKLLQRLRQSWGVFAAGLAIAVMLWAA